MKITGIYLLLFSFLIMLPYAAPAQEEAAARNLTFTVVTIPDFNVPEYLNKDSIVRIKKPLKNKWNILNDYRPGLDENINFDNCVKRDCITEISNVFHQGIVIIISITASEVKTGEKHISRYLVEDITETRYTVYVFTAGSSDQKYDLTFRRTFLDSTRLLNEAELIGIKIAEFYSN